MLFLHFAKTGGSSIRRMLVRSRAHGTFDCVHNGTCIGYRDGKVVARNPVHSSDLPAYDIAFYVVRHPLERLFSCHRYFLHGGLNQYQRGTYPLDQRLQEFLQAHAPTFQQCCEKLPEIASVIPHMRPLAGWLAQLPNPLAPEVFTARHESFESDVRGLFRRLGMDDSGQDLVHVNQSLTRDPMPDLDDIQRERVHRYYAEDFARFGYSP